MNRYLLDTAPLASYLFSRRGAMALIGPWLRHREVATSILCHGEVVEYLHSHADFAQRQRELRELLIEIPPLLLDYGMLERYADIRRALRPPHGPGVIGDMDTLIAATALERDLTLVTGDQHFQRVPGLTVMLIERQELRQ
ncbi:MAG: type II toxin-antitoxin system VapC family toxin [Thermomicrobiales bacterium]